jgi:hypothetical protein
MRDFYSLKSCKEINRGKEERRGRIGLNEVGRGGEAEKEREGKQ